MRVLRLAPLAFLLGAACLPRFTEPPPAWPAADLVVAQDSTGQFSTIGAAVAAASDGSTILIKPGVYSEQVTLARARRITLLGTDPLATCIDGTDGYACLEISSDSNRIVGLCLRGADAHGAWVRDGHQSFRRCLVVGNGDNGIYLSAMVGSASADIDHCTISDNGRCGIYAARASPATSVTNCIVAFNPRGISADETDSLDAAHNTLWNTAVDLENVIPSGDCSLADPRFVDRDSGDYRLLPSSPCIGTAGDRTNRGCH